MNEIEQMARLVDSANTLTQTINGKIGEIDNTVKATLTEIKNAANAVNQTVQNNKAPQTRYVYVDPTHENSKDEQGYGSSTAPYKSIEFAVKDNHHIHTLRIHLEKDSVHVIKGQHVCKSTNLKVVVRGDVGNGDRATLIQGVEGEFSDGTAAFGSIIMRHVSASITTYGINLETPVIDPLQPAHEHYNLFRPDYEGEIARWAFYYGELRLGSTPLTYQNWQTSIILSNVSILSKLPEDHAHRVYSRIFFSHTGHVPVSLRASSVSLKDGLSWRDIFRAKDDGSNIITNLSSSYFIKEA